MSARASVEGGIQEKSEERVACDRRQGRAAWHTSSSDGEETNGARGKGGRGRGWAVAQWRGENCMGRGRLGGEGKWERVAALVGG